MKQINIKFVNNFAQELKKAEIGFFFLDDRWKLSGDVDLCVSRKDLERFDSLMRKKGFVKYHTYEYWKKSYRKYLNKEIIDVDVHIGKYEGTAKGILDPNVTEGVLDPNRQLFYFIYRLALGEPLSKYEKMLPGLAKKMDSSLLSYLRSCFMNPEEVVGTISKRRWGTIKPKFLWWHNLVRAAHFIRNHFFSVFERLSRIIYPNPYIIIMGADGSGKTTTVENVNKVFANSKLKIRVGYGGRYQFRILPINTLIKSVTEKKERKTKDKVIRYDSALVRLVTPFLYYVEYLFRYILLIYPRRTKYHLVLEDRHYLDLLTSRNANSTVVRLLYLGLPKPDWIIYLYNDVNEIMGRRPKHSIQDLKYQQRVFSKYQGFDTRIRSNTKDQTLREVMEFILPRLKK